MYNRTLPDYNFDKDKKKRSDDNLLEMDNDEWNNFILKNSNTNGRRK